MTDTPTDLAEALEWNPPAKMAWEALDPEARRGHADRIAEAEEPDARARRIAETIERLSPG
ncbi:MAG: YdeI/OmpD-associated family protein [Acidimicrobiia bacterium]|nr:YdeI/OmpD-associated family protein [Acidimicrobiia bacterium]